MSENHKTKHILVVDDEEGVRLLLRECFEMEGFSVTEAENGAELKAALDNETIDLVTLDLNLGGENGFDLVREIRTAQNIPIIMITGKGDTIDRVVGLELGADDYIAKPFQLREVLARVRAVLRRYDPAQVATPVAARTVNNPDECIRFEGLELNVAKRSLVANDGSKIELTTGEFEQRPERVLSRDNIMDLLKGHEWSPMDRSIDALVVRLRRKIEPDPGSPKFIKTVRGVGYVFAAEIT